MLFEQQQAAELVDARSRGRIRAAILRIDHPVAVGVVDSQDRCPNTPTGSRVDQFGCLLLFEEHAPAAPGAPPARPTLILQGVNFQTGRSVLTASSYAVLDQVAASLVANPAIRIEIAGYTDSTGRKLTNMRLSMGRAGAVQHYLARKGVNPMRMDRKSVV